MPRPTRFLLRTAPGGGLSRDRIGTSLFSGIVLLHRDEVDHLLDHPSEGGRVVDDDLAVRAAQPEPAQRAALRLGAADAAPHLGHLELRLHGLTSRTLGRQATTSFSSLPRRRA